MVHETEPGLFNCLEATHAADVNLNISAVQNTFALCKNPLAQSSKDGP